MGQSTARDLAREHASNRAYNHKLGASASDVAEPPGAIPLGNVPVLCQQDEARFKAVRVSTTAKVRTRDELDDDGLPTC